jgi:hypothetical protein
MSKFLELYTAHGLSRIVFESLKEKEVESGYGRDLTWETVVAHKGTGFVRVVAQERFLMVRVAAARVQELIQKRQSRKLSIWKSRAGSRSSTQPRRYKV